MSLTSYANHFSTSTNYVSRRVFILSAAFLDVSRALLEERGDSVPGYCSPRRLATVKDDANHLASILRSLARKGCSAPLRPIVSLLYGEISVPMVMVQRLAGGHYLAQE